MSSIGPNMFPFRSGRRWLWIFFTVLIFVLIHACHRADRTASETNHSQENDHEQPRNKSAIVLTPLHEYFLSIQQSGADFNPNFVSDYRKFDLDTIPPKKAAIKLGVLAADIGYLSTYWKTQEALNYIEICVKLAKTVCDEDVISFDVLERFERNLSYPDSIIQILNQFNDNTVRYLLDQEQRNLGLLMLFGAFIEAQYITTQVIKYYPEDLLPDNMRWHVLSPLISMVLDQRGFVMNLIAELESLDQKEDWELACLNSLKELDSRYTEPVVMFYPYPPELTSFKRILLLSEQIDQIRIALVY